MPIVVSEFRSTDSRRLRAAKSTKSFALLQLSFLVRTQSQGFGVRASAAALRMVPQGWRANTESMLSDPHPLAASIRLVPDQLSIGKKDQALGEALSKRPLVGHQHHRHAELLVALPEQV